MIRTAGHVVNDGLVPAHAELSTLPVVDGVDFAASVANVTAWGGQAWLYALAVLRGLDAAAGGVDADLARSVGSLAGWRSGVLDLRDDARTRLAGLLDAGREPVAAAVLGLPVGAVDDFAHAQRDRSLAWPLLDPSATVARVGGFGGLGGAWTAPPRSVGRARTGQLVVTCTDGSGWRLEADVFGDRLTALDAGAAGETADVTTGVVVSDRSYLLSLTGELA